VLLRYDGKTAAWFRVEPRAAIVAGETILSLPEFRPKVAMISGLHLDMSGGTAVVVEGEGIAPKADADSAAAAPGIPSVDVYGRIVLVNRPTAKAGAAQLVAEPARPTRTERDAGRRG
jgi:hypothetical protein